LNSRDDPNLLYNRFPCLNSLDGLFSDREADRFEVLDTLLELLVRDSGAERGTIFLVDRESHEIFSAATRGRELEGLSLPMGKGVAGRTARTGEITILDNAYSSPHFDPQIDELTGYKTENLLTAPVGRNPVMAVIQLLNKPGGFAKNDADFVGIVADRLSEFLQS